MTGDFNGDGRPDLAVANYGDNDVSVLLGNGDGTFQNQVTYAVGSSPALVTGDFNGDGRTDLAVANQDSNDVSVLLGNGDGTFQNQVTYAVGSAPYALVAGDFNGDGRTDLAVANSYDNDVSVLLGNGDGTFQDQKTYRWGTGPRPSWRGLQRRRPHRPGRRQPYGNDVSVLLGLNGTFAAPGPFAINPHATPLVADVNGDGTNDALVVNAAGNILYRQGIPGQPGSFDPPSRSTPAIRRGTSPGFRIRSKAPCSPVWTPPITRSRCTAGATAPSSGSGRSPPVRSRRRSSRATSLATGKTTSSSATRATGP